MYCYLSPDCWVQVGGEGVGWVEAVVGVWGSKVGDGNGSEDIGGGGERIEEATDLQVALFFR